jgi:hypothetical protein
MRKWNDHFFQRTTFPSSVKLRIAGLSVGAGGTRSNKLMRFATDRNRSGVDQLEHLLFVEIDDCMEAFNWPTPPIDACTRRIETSYPDQAATFLCRIGEISGRQGWAIEVLERAVVALSHRRLPSGVLSDNATGILQFLGYERALDIWDCVPVFDLRSAKINNRFVDGPVAAGDDERLTDKRLPWLPGKNIGLQWLVEIDPSKAGRGVNVARVAQNRDRGPDFLSRQ